ncbi:MAG: glutathione S-transferase family protein [Pseudooceanicola sp.]|nr:glutathione S-transferase family protein [Pseudooceanicola sp.]
MLLYYFPGTISIAVAIALHEAGLPFETARVDFSNAEQTKADYHAINPKGRVPALKTDHGILTETGAILDYIAALAPGAGLVPADPFQAARMREVMYYLASTAHVNHAHKMRGARWASQETSFADMKAKVPETMTASAAYLEGCLTGPFVLGDGVSLADCYLFVVASWMPGDKVDLSAFPKLTAFLAAMEQRPSVQAVRAAGML